MAAGHGGRGGQSARPLARHRMAGAGRSREPGAGFREGRHVPYVQRAMTRILVTGGAGFIGANFVHHTVTHRPDVSITVLDALTYAANESSLAPVRDRIDFMRGDIADAALLDDLVRDCDLVVHFAA